MLFLLYVLRINVLQYKQPYKPALIRAAYPGSGLDMLTLNTSTSTDRHDP
jgi:hypothetical protein